MADVNEDLRLVVLMTEALRTTHHYNMRVLNLKPSESRCLDFWLLGWAEYQDSRIKKLDIPHLFLNLEAILCVLGHIEV